MFKMYYKDIFYRFVSIIYILKILLKSANFMIYKQLKIIKIVVL